MSNRENTNQGPLLRLLMAAVLLPAVALLWLAPPACGQYGKPQVRKDPRELRKLAFQHYMEGQFDDAALYYEEAIEAGKNVYGEESTFVADLYYDAGSMCLEEKNFQRASRYLPEAVDRRPNNTQARIKLAELLMMKGKSDEAFGQVAEALNRNPNSVEAQQALVKLMMKRAENSAAANLACTWESYRLNSLGKLFVSNTWQQIKKWQDMFSTRTPPTVAVVSPGARPKANPKLIKPVQPKPAPKPQKKSKPKPRAKPKPKPRTRPKPKAKPKAKTVVAKKKAPAKVVRKRRKTRTRAGLVPPPPPVIPVFGTQPPQQSSAIKLQTEAKRVEKKKTRKKKKRKKKKPKPTVPDEPDFILDWADVKKSK